MADPPDDGPPPPTDNVTQFDPTKRRRKRKPPSVPFGGWPAWHEKLRFDNGRVIPDLANVLIAIRNDAELDHAIAFEEVRQHSIANRTLPTTEEGKVDKPVPREIDDDDIGRLQEWLQSMGMPRISREVVWQAVEIMARERSFHPIRDWLDSVPWDGQRRIVSPTRGSWLTTHFGAVAQPADYLATIGQLFLVSMIARIYEPGCKADYMLVLEGDQGVEKSRACAALAGEWFGDCLPDIHSKDAKQYLRGKWLIEVSELSAFNKADIESLKAFITRQTEDYRPPYGRHNVQQPRQCVFVGTTNRAAYIKDDTGARRFWPVKVGRIDIEKIERDREQLLVEALNLYRSNASWWPAQELEQRLIKPEQETRIETDPWEEGIARYVDDDIVRRNRVTISEIAKQALGFDHDARVGTAEARRIAGVLQSWGWTAGRDKHTRFYERNLRGDADDAGDALAQ